MKNYIVFVNDHSGSMQGAKARAALADYNTMSGAFRDAANREMLDTVVSVIGIGLGKGFKSNREGYGVKRQIQISNPHVLKPVTTWDTSGGTPLWDGIGAGIELMDSLPDINDLNVSVLFVVTTDGAEFHSERYTLESLRALVQARQNTGRWTFTFRIPKGQEHTITPLGVPVDNIQAWDNTAEGLKASTAKTVAAVDTFYAARSAGATSSTVFYANAAKVDTSALVDISSKVSVYQVPVADMGILIKDFILTKRQEYLIGAAFYQLTKTEPRVSPTKLILIREKATGKVYSGTDARKMIGLDTVNNARLHPGDHGNYEIYIQSEAWNRKLVGGSLVLYWAEKGRPMTQADLEKYAAQNKPAAPAVLQGLAVPPTNKPTPSPIPVAKKVVDLSYVNGRKVYGVYDTREQARRAGAPSGRFVKDIKDFPGNALEGGKRWFLFV